ncbi:EamA family transporter RarD [Peptoniphilus sp. HCN-40583]|uniref:EamA family transporter RarD n=1 Tax=Peptoniphilus sp. HCN-40583 TaxID=3134662 RepID=UPI0030BEFC41
MPGSLKVLACYLMWAFLVLYWPLFGAMDPLAVLSFRIVFSMLFCLIVMLIMGEGPAILALMKDKKQMLFLFFAGITITINWGSYIIAVMTGRVIDASLAYYMSPIFSIVLGFFIYNERLRPMQWVAFVLAIIGVTVPIIAYGQVPVFAIIIGTSFAVYGAIKKQITASGMLSIFMETLMVLPIALIYLMAFSHLEGLGVRDYLLIPTMGIATTVPLLLFAVGMKDTSLSVAGVLMYINPTIQLLLGVFIMGEDFTTIHAWMFVFVWAGVELFLADGFRERKRSGELKEEQAE